MHQTARPDTDPDEESTSRRRFLAATAMLPVVAAAPFVIDRLRTDSPATNNRPGLELRVTSNDGRYQALADPLPDGGSIYAPGGRPRSTIAVRDQLTGTTRSMTLDRNLEPEAFSPDGRTLFAIDHRPADAPVAYRVSTIDVEEAIITDTLGPRKIAVTEEMRGSGRQQVWSPLDDQLYTLYIRQSQQGGAETAAFVHVLDVATDWALCVALPDGFGLGPPDSTAIMIDQAGLTITAVDRSLGSMVEVTRLPDTSEEDGRFEVSGFMPIAE
jgi:hypothetical protein